jgi:hypothetical protein
LNIEERANLVKLRVANTSYEKLMKVMESLKDDPVNQRKLMDAVRNYVAPIGTTESKAERVGHALMLPIFEYVEAEIMEGMK